MPHFATRPACRPEMNPLLEKSAVELAALLADRQVSATELCELSIERSLEVDATLNCFADLWIDEARAVAKRADQAAAKGGSLGPLHGLPIAVKDTTPTKGKRTTLGSFTHEHWVPDHSSSIVESLQRAGAVIVGKTTTPEFAHTLLTDSPLLGVTRNPWDVSKTPGGSSGGSAAAVATGCVVLAEGTDMGGSVRIPAAWCGLVGLKPGIGRIPMDVLPALFDSISHHGPLARSIDDARLFLACTQGPNDCDIQSVTTPLDLSRPLDSDLSGVRIGLSIDLGSWAVEPSIEAAVRQCADHLRAAGAVVEEVPLYLGEAHDDAWTKLWGVFMASYYGHFVDDFEDRLDPAVLRLIRLGQSLSAVEYKKLEFVRTDMWQQLRPIFGTFDALICPTMAAGPLPASKAEQRRAAPPTDGRHHSVDMTSVFNLVAACPVVSVPAGFDSDGLPVGMQIVGKRWREDDVLRIGKALESYVRFTPPPFMA